MLYGQTKAVGFPSIYKQLSLEYTVNNNLRRTCTLYYQKPAEKVLVLGGLPTHFKLPPHYTI